MIFVAELAFARGTIEEDLLNLHRSTLSAVGLPISLTAVEGANNWSSLYAAMALDKKSRGSEIRFVTLTELGKCDRTEGVTEDELRSAYEKVLS
jgi:3-dehydroquinate synthase